MKVKCLAFLVAVLAAAAAFACTVVDDAGAVVAEAALNAYRPPDMEQFMKEQTKT